MDNKNLQRDPGSGAIINTNASALREHKSRKQLLDRISKLEQEIVNINKKISQLQTEKIE